MLDRSCLLKQKMASKEVFSLLPDIEEILPEVLLREATARRFRHQGKFDT